MPKYPNINCDNTFIDYHTCENCMKNNLNDCLHCVGSLSLCNACKHKSK